jgi:hypothetical protein
MFKWAAGNELILFEAYQRLAAVDGLRKGRTEARETAPVPPVSDDVVEPTFFAPHLSADVADMVPYRLVVVCALQDEPRIAPIAPRQAPH